MRSNCLNRSCPAAGRRLHLETLESRQMLNNNWVVSFIDDFSADTSANYTRTAPLARPGSALPTLNISGGALTLTGEGQTGDVTQAITFHNTETLNIGETVLLDVDLAGGTFGDGNEMIGLALSAGIMTGVSPIPPAANVDARDDEFSFFFGGFRLAGLGDDYRSDGFLAVDLGQISGGEQAVDQSGGTGGDLSTIASLYITRLATSSYELGWVDHLGDLHSVRTVVADLGEAPSIGIFTDMRDRSGGGESSFNQTVDNLRIVSVEDPYPENPVRFPRQVENLDRGIVAVRRSSSQVYVGWRLLGNEDPDTQFVVYRSANGGAPIRLHLDPITTSTNYVDATVNLSLENTYSVRAIVDGVEQPSLGSFTLPASSPVQQFLSIPLLTPANGVTPLGENYSYEANDASVGDLDGDGDYEVILKWEPSNKTSNAADGFTGNTLVDAYTLEGQFLWRIDLGINIRSGPHLTQFLVYDFDGDGRSEVVMRTAPGTKDGLGNDIILPGDDPDADYRETSGSLEGIVVSGPEYLTVFDGLTGGELATTMFPLERQTLESWGDNYANRSDRYMAGVAYLDGERPSIVWTRGIYGPAAGFSARNEQVALDWRDGQLTQRWRFNAVTGGANSEFVGEGAQSLSIADVDGDGFDEIVYGAAVVDHDGTLLYATELGHGDALHVSDMDPSNPGLEIFMPHEDASGNGMVGGSLRDAMTGELISSIPGTGDIGRGVAADIDPNHPGFEYWVVTGDPAPGGGPVHNAQDGYLYQSPSNMFTNFVIWWDADLSRELLDRTTISEWNNPGRSNFDLDPETSGLQWFAAGASDNNDSKQTPVLSADIFGDWREEVVWRRSDNSELLIYTTIISASNRIYTLMHDTQYREAIAWQNVGYNQPPHPSFFLGAGMDDPPQPLIYFAGQTEGNFDGDGDADGADFLAWQRDYSSQYDQSALAEWEANYGITESSPAQELADSESAFAAAPLDASSATSVGVDTQLIDAALAVQSQPDESRRAVSLEFETGVTIPVPFAPVISHQNDIRDRAHEQMQEIPGPLDSYQPDEASWRREGLGVLMDDIFIEWRMV